MSANPSTTPKKAPFPWLQALCDRIPGSDMYEGELTGRRLLSVWALRFPGQDYRYDGEADCFWLQLSGDDADHHVWVRPDWIVNFFDKTWLLLPRAVVAPAASELEVVRLDHEPWLQRPEWHSLMGLTLSEVRVADSYEPQECALSLFFKREGEPDSGARVASMQFDWGSDKDEAMENTLLHVSDKFRLGVWPLGSEVQGFLESPRGDWSNSRQSPAHPWNDEAHWQALTRFRRELQSWLMGWGGLVAGALDLPARQAATVAPFKLLDKLCAFEIRLGHRSVWQASGSGWRDRDGEDFGEHWLRFTDGGHTDRSMAQETWEALIAAWPLLAQDRYANAWLGLGLDLHFPRVQRQAGELSPVWAAHASWWPQFQALLSKNKP